MHKTVLWSLRLGFSAKQSTKIEQLGIKPFLNNSFNAPISKKEPAFLQDTPKTIAEIKSYRKKIKAAAEGEKKKLRKTNKSYLQKLNFWWLNKMRSDDYPLREKMTCFWHNHFVATAKKVKVPYWIYQHNNLLREQAFGNFRELTRSVLKSNAIIKYLDNDGNKIETINENLSRELLELFTLGVGNYTEMDVKNGARALAGLSPNDNKARYRPKQEDNDTKTYLGKTGNLKVDDLVDAIFEHKNAPYRITKKILQWFIYDNPNENLIKYYGDYLKIVDYEIKPLLTKIFTEEYTKKNAGSKIKDPLLYALQLLDELQVSEIKPKQLDKFLMQQGMDLYNQPNVKGWEGGKAWLTSQVFLQRNKLADMLCKGKVFNEGKFEKVTVNLNWNKTGQAKQIIQELSDRLLFQVGDELQENMNEILNYDFNPQSPNANQAVLRLFNFIAKTPEYQII